MKVAKQATVNMNKAQTAADTATKAAKTATDAADNLDKAIKGFSSASDSRALVTAMNECDCCW